MAFIYTVNRHRVSPEFIESRKCVPIPSTAIGTLGGSELYRYAISCPNELGADPMAVEGIGSYPVSKHQIRLECGE